jgi:ABC-type transport system involved in multi-copper enzyme maturation permease subunit
MRGVYFFSLMTLHSLFRRRTVWGVGLVSLFALVALGSIPSFGVATGGTFLLDMGLTCVEIGGLLLAIALAAGLYPRDRESRTVMPLLASPLSRGQYLLGRFLGASLVEIFFILAWIVGLAAVLAVKGLNVPASLLPAGLLLAIEGCFLLAVVFFFSFWTSPPLNAPLTLLVFIVSQMSVREIVSLAPSAEPAMRILRLLLPHMDVFHVKDPIAHGFAIEPLYFALAILYGIAFTCFMLSVALAVFRSRDLR